MKNKNWFWGVFFIISAIFVIASQTGSFGKIGFLSVSATVLLVACVIHSIFKRNFFEFFIPLSFLYMIYSKPLSLIYISPWLLLLSALLVSIGFSLIFKRSIKKIKWSHKYTDNYCGKIKENDDNDNPYAKVSLSSTSKFLHSDCLKGGYFVSSLGDLELYFDQVRLKDDKAEIYLENKMGTIKLYVPKHWIVVDKMHSVLGEVVNHTQTANHDEGAPRLTLTGEVVMGTVIINYIY